MAKVETDKENSKETWIATKEEVGEQDFEETRRCLLTSYHSYVQIHSGYVITLIIGLATFIPTVIFTFGTLFKSLVGIFAFGFLIAGIVIMFAFMVYMVLRIFYWTIYANVALSLPIDKALENFNDFINKNKNKALNRKNKYGKYDFSYKAPNTSIIGNAIASEIQNDFSSYTWYKKFVLRRFRPRTTTENSSDS
jgi:hypothetical protein